MHVHHSTILHDDFSVRFANTLGLFKSHPILREKRQLLESLHPQRVRETRQKTYALAQLVLQREKPLWFQMGLLQLRFIDSKRELDEFERSFVKKQYPTILASVGSQFEQLLNYAISETEYYPQAYNDYQRFQHAFDALLQKDEIIGLLDKQVLLCKKIQVRADADFLSELVDRLQLTHLDQLALVSRIPHDL